MHWWGFTFPAIEHLWASRHELEIEFSYYKRQIQVIPILWTHCYLRHRNRRLGGFGGWRPWFQCPSCRKRTAYLYCEGFQYQCRNCLNLIYECQLKSAKGRKFRTLEKLKQRLGGYGTLDEPIPPRPYQIKRATYARIAGKAQIIGAQLGIGACKMSGIR